jgi:hypothetical protein
LNLLETLPSVSIAMQEFQIGDRVWAKLKGHPWWPSKIEDEKLLALDVTSAKQPGQVPVYFFGAHNFGWVNPTPEYLKPFDDKSVVLKKGKMYLLGLEEIEDQSKWPNPNLYIQQQEITYDIIEPVKIPKKRKTDQVYLKYLILDQ